MGLRNPPLVEKTPYNNMAARASGTGGPAGPRCYPLSRFAPLGSCGTIERTPKLPQPLLELIQLFPEAGRQAVPECLEMLLDVRHLSLPLGEVHLQECP